MQASQLDHNTYRKYIHSYLLKMLALPSCSLNSKNETFFCLDSEKRLISWIEFFCLINIIACNCRTLDDLVV